MCDTISRNRVTQKRENRVFSIINTAVTVRYSPESSADRFNFTAQFANGLQQLVKLPPLP